MRHADLVSALRTPGAYDHRVDRVEFLQTHISSVFLTGQFAYKLKKPVNFGFLDFSTLELRERFCRAEVELNRRLAPQVYLGVEPVVRRGADIRVGGRGEVLDWVVAMRQLPADRHGPVVLDSGELGRPHIDELIAILVPFYRDARSGEEISRFGALEAVRFNTDENFGQTREAVGKLITVERYRHIREWTESFYSRHGGLFEERIAAGRVRESHGDLHLGNIFFTDPPVIFDCIEFNERFRCGDIAADLAFLAMDLDFRGRPDLATYLIDSYVQESGDLGLLDVLDFYKCYRAYVRGKVASFSAADPALDDTQRRAQRNLARHYFGLAYAYAGGRGRPPLVVVHGLMGTGKTQIGRFLRDSRGWHLISTDAVRKQISGVGENTRVYVPYNQGLYSPEMNRRTYEEVCRRAENLLRGGFAVVVDGAFKRQRERLPVFSLAERAGAELLFLEAWCSPEEQRRRLETRRRHDTRSDGRVELMERQRSEFEPPNPEHADRFCRVSTEGPPSDTRDRVTDLLSKRGLLAAVTTGAPG